MSDHTENGWTIVPRAEGGWYMQEGDPITVKPEVDTPPPKIAVQTLAATSAARYPAELLQQVFEHFYPSEKTLSRSGTRSKAGRTLLKLALVCKQFKQIVTPIIYEDLQVDAVSLTPNASLYATLQDPQIARLVRSVDWIATQEMIEGEPSGSSTNGAVAAACDSRQILRLCVSVTSLVINSTARTNAVFFNCDAFRSLPLCATLQSLDITVGQATFPKSMAQFISTLPALINLVIHKNASIYHDNHSGVSLPVLHPNAKLSSLELHNMDPARNAIPGGLTNLEQLMRTDTLTKLTITQTTAPFFDPLKMIDIFSGPTKEPFLALTHLSISGIKEATDSSFNWLRLFNLFPKIRHLSLTAAPKENELLKSCFEAFRESPSFHTVDHLIIELSTHFTAARFNTLLDSYQPDNLTDLTITTCLPRQMACTFPEGLVNNLQVFLDVVQELTRKQMMAFVELQEYKMSLRVVHEKQVVFALTADEDGKTDGELHWVGEKSLNNFVICHRHKWAQGTF